VSARLASHCLSRRAQRCSVPTGRRPVPVQPGDLVLALPQSRSVPLQCSLASSSNQGWALEAADRIQVAADRSQPPVCGERWSCWAPSVQLGVPGVHDAVACPLVAVACFDVAVCLTDVPVEVAGRCCTDSASRPGSIPGPVLIGCGVVYTALYHQLAAGQSTARWLLAFLYNRLAISSKPGVGWPIHRFLDPTVPSGTPGKEMSSLHPSPAYSVLPSGRLPISSSLVLRLQRCHCRPVAKSYRNTHWSSCRHSAT
jgi:hypothetical protein